MTDHRLNRGELIALIEKLTVLLDYVNFGVDAMLNDETCLLDYDEPALDTLNDALPKLKAQLALLA